MIELNVHLLERLFVGDILSIRLPRVVSQLRTCRLRAFVCRNSEKHCVLDKVSVVYFKGKLYFSRRTRFVKRELFLVVYILLLKNFQCASWLLFHFIVALTVIRFRKLSYFFFLFRSICCVCSQTTSRQNSLNHAISNKLHQSQTNSINLKTN